MPLTLQPSHYRWELGVLPAGYVLALLDAPTVYYATISQNCVSACRYQRTCWTIMSHGLHDPGRTADPEVCG